MAGAAVVVAAAAGAAADTRRRRRPYDVVRYRRCPGPVGARAGVMANPASTGALVPEAAAVGASAPPRMRCYARRYTMTPGPIF